MSIMRAAVYVITVLFMLKPSQGNKNISKVVSPTLSTRSMIFSTFEQDLLSHLLTNYSINARPTASNKAAVNVDFDFKLSKLVKLDIKEQVLIANSRITMRWFDPRLTWNAADYNGTKYLNIRSSLVWTPDILLHNTAVQDSKGKSDVYKARVRVQYNGVVNWMSPVTIQASCSLEIKWFPFDKQTCELNFGSISYTKSKLRILFRKKPMALKEVKAKFHYSSGDWIMTQLTSQIVDEVYECCMDPFSIVRYTLKWKRLTIYWLLYLVFPCLCLSFIALFTFFIPAESGERTGFGITTVLAMSVYLLVISDKLPEKSDQSPLIGVLYVILFFLMVGVLLSAIITTNLAFKKTKPPGYLKRLLKSKKNARPSRVLTPVTVIQNQVDTDFFDQKTEKGEALEMTLTNRRPSVKRCASVTTADGEESNSQEEWQEIARYIDHRLFWVFLAFTIIGPSIVFIVYSV